MFHFTFGYNKCSPRVYYGKCGSSDVFFYSKLINNELNIPSSEHLSISYIIALYVLVEDATILLMENLIKPYGSRYWFIKFSIERSFQKKLS